VKFLVLSALVAGVALAGTAQGAVSQSKIRQIEQAREATHRCQDRLGLKRSPVGDETPEGKRYRSWVLTLWQTRRDVYCQAYRELQSISYAEVKAAGDWADSSGPSCVSSHEGAVSSNTGNGYYGKWQADESFQYAYGREYVQRWGLAHNWPAWAQDVMAYRGWQDRGWGPWPTTSVMCGLR
jgi:hypothetical protein